MVTGDELLEHVKLSVQDVIAPRFKGGLRELLQGASDGFLSDLLYLQLRTEGFAVTRGFAADGCLPPADLALHGGYNVYVEIEQRRLSDGGASAGAGLAGSLRRHNPSPSVGVLYVIDDRALPPLPRRASGPNYTKGLDDLRTAPLLQLQLELEGIFEQVTPGKLARAVMGRFAGAGGLDVYAWIVADPRI